MSTPACRRPQRMPNGGRDRPVDGPDQAARALADRAGRRRPGRTASAASTAACSFSSAREVALEVVAVRAGRGERARLDRRARPRSAFWRSTSRSLIAATSAAAAATSAVTLRWRSSSASRRFSVGDRLRLRLPDAVDDARVLLRDALHELRALEQVGEAVGLEDHGDDVGLVGLVELHEPVAQRGARLGQPRAQPHQADALAAQLVLDARELGALGVEVGLDPRLARLQGRDVALRAR